ncbi:hypothetical protein [Kutzneria sp. CA-103260]|uniref:hypothetical protein n=1 Tax=Kutzneria sp. CA-103260 TaxID=2802641 RepID=UPI001BA6D186|nr:hypothetical protein [Kutzneria sp. CA-103260]QUQ64049.1 hypothetical protein JJ691_17690 [Kutzneria sp. CA-103260]
MSEWTAIETAAIVRAARGAPVLCREQPWVLEFRGHGVELREVIGGERRDPGGIDRLLSCGAALANVVLAVRALGWDITLEVEAGADLVGRVTAVRSEPPCPRELELYRSIAAPDVMRRGHGGAEELHRLTAISHFRTARLEPVGGVPFAAILHDASRQLDGDRRCAAELAPWQRQLALTGPTARRSAIAAMADRLAVRPMLAVVTDSDVRSDHVLAGAVIQVAMLAAPGLGFIPHAVVRPMHLRDTRLRLMNAFAFSGFPQALLGLTPAELNPWSQT